MTDRHIHCVYFQYTDSNKVDGYCLLKQAPIKKGYLPHCENIVYKPSEVLEYFLKLENYCKDWECANKKATEFIKNYHLNNYPKKVKK